MDLPTSLMLFAAGLAGGTLSSLVGGAAVVTFPAMLASGLSPVVAVASGLMALTPGNFLAALYDRRQLPPFNRAFVGLVAASLLGALGGAILLMSTPTKVFEILVPLLLGFATVMFALSEKISVWLRARAAAAGRAHRPFSGTNFFVLLPVSVYGGYFGAGVGVLILAVLSLGGSGDYRATNVTKNLITSLNSLIAALLFVSRGAVSWPPTLAMMAGAIIGAMIGARLAQVVPRAVMRVVVVAVGALLTVIYAWRYWF
jgi:uncharacterized membrane protein YfcA